MTESEAWLAEAQRAQQLNALHDMGQTVTATLDLEVVFDRVLEKLRPLLGAEGVFILLREDADRLVFAAANETGVGDLAGKRVAAADGIAGDVLRTAEVHWLHGEETLERIYHEIKEVAGYHPRAILAAPLKLHGELIGVLEAVHGQPDAFDVQDKTIIESAANWTAIAIGNARLFQAQQEARQTAETLRAANATLSETLDLPTVLETLLNYADELIGFDKALVLLAHRGERLRIEAWRGFEEADFRRLLLSLDDFPAFRRLFEERTCIVVANAGDDPEWTTLEEEPHTDAGWLVVPLVAGDRTIGAVALMRREPHAYNERHITPAEGLAAQATIAIQNARLFAQVQTDQRRLRQLNRKVVKAQEEERQRVSRELHDEAGQALTALKINLEMIRNRWTDMPPSAKQQMEEAIAMTDQTMEQIRLLAHNLRPPILEAFGLTPSLEGLVRDFGRRTDLEIDFQGNSIPKLPEAVTISLYRFVQEALTNVARHAAAENVNVELRTGGDNITVAVTDDGTGFNVEETMAAAQQRDGIGLMGMQDRIELLNGWVEIESTPGQGTRAAAHVPYQEAP